MTYSHWRTTYTNIVSKTNAQGTISTLAQHSQLLFDLQFSTISLSLPQNINLLTFEPWKDGTILMRFEHILEKDEDVVYSSPVSFNFKDVFHAFNIYDLRETTLAANQWLNDKKRFAFRSEKTTPASTLNVTDVEQLQQMLEPTISNEQSRRKRPKSKMSDVDEDDIENYTITLKPMQIRTFIVTLEWKP